MPYIIPPRRVRSCVAALSSAALLIGVVPTGAQASDAHHRAQARHSFMLHADPYARVVRGASEG